MDAEAMLRELQAEMARDLPPEMRRLMDDAIRDASKSSSSSSRRMVVRDGKTVIDEKGGKPVPGRRAAKPSGRARPKAGPAGELPPLRPVRLKDGVRITPTKKPQPVPLRRVAPKTRRDG